MQRGRNLMVNSQGCGTTIADKGHATITQVNMAAVSPQRRAKAENTKAPSAVELAAEHGVQRGRNLRRRGCGAIVEAPITQLSGAAGIKQR